MKTESDLVKNRFIRFRNKTKTMSSIYEIIMSDYPDTPASQWLDESEAIVTVSFRTMNEHVKGMAAHLTKMLGKKNQGSFVGLSMDNSDLWQVCFWALLMAGYKPALIDVNLKEEIIDHINENAGIKAILCKGGLKLKNRVLQVSPDELKPVIEAAAGAKDSVPAADFVPQWADNLALCTSGTTATAKVLVFNGAAVTGELEGFYAAYLKEPLIGSAPTPVKPLAFLPMHHILGFITLCIAYPFWNTTVVYLRDRAPLSIMAACKKIGVTHMVSVPLLINNLKNAVFRKIRHEEPKKEKMFRLLLNASLLIQKIAPKSGELFVRKHVTASIIKNLLGDTFAWICVGGTHVPVDSLKFINGLGYRATIGYGMTECGIIAFEPGTDFRRRIDGSTGPLMHGFSGKIVDANGKDAKNGELLIKGTPMHIGIMQNGKMAPPALDGDGWLHTGDIARFDKGSVIIEGRLKEVILNEAGENIYPDELEDMFVDDQNLFKGYCILGLNNNGNDEIALVAEAQDAFLGEKGLAEISRRVGDVNAQLPIMKQIKRLYVANEPMPLANGIKVRRQKLKELLENGKFPATEIQIAARAIAPTAKSAGSARPGSKSKKPEQEDKFLQILEQVIQCFAEILDVEPEKIGADMRFVEDLGGDSLDSLGLLAMAEARFGILIQEADYYRCKTANDVSRLLYEKLFGDFPESSCVAARKSPETNRAAVKPITRIEDMPEYGSFLKRFEGTDASMNPYYICNDSTLRDTSIVRGKRVINFGSYNYLGLSGNPQVSQAAIKAIETLGTSASGSRLLTGEKSLHRELEKELADWKKTEAALVLVGGHSTNVTFVGNFCNENDLVLYDALSHNSIAQGVQLSRATARLFPHNDYKTARAILSSIRDKFEKVLLLIEGVYSMDGDIAPVPEFVKLKKEFNLFLMVDEAHSSCVIGKNGEGVDEYFNLSPNDIDIKMGTLSKGLGTCGGFLAGKKALIEYLKYTLPGFVFSVGLSPPLAAAALESIRIIRKDNSLVRQLHENIKYFISKAKSNGFNLCMAGESAVAPILVGKDIDAFALSAALLGKGIFVPPAVYPAVPAGKSRMRFCLTSCHNKSQIDFALDTLKELALEMNIKLPG